MSYFTNVGSPSGPILERHGFYAIPILPDPRARSPIGFALATDRDRDGLALWELTIHDFEVPGRWVVVDRQFRPAPCCAACAAP
jgi:hypothetical protein